ncbi:serine/threonine-protein kinase [Actinoplanes sp. NPDC049802]|uniref:serine/threonine-protein kinase n=1 Tax=Actinoplanes sp. NPDC049802 TaxID=3154742 RepID=UPI0033E86B45
MPLTPLVAGDPVRLGDVVLLGRLGSGGMGTVYLGRDPDGRQVAVKVVRPEVSADPRFLARFRSEVKRARQVPPFCTAAVLHSDLEHDPPYLVVEFVDGPSLAEVVRERGALNPSDLYAVAVGVATALVAIHGAGVVHRDLKPANVLLAVGLPKVIDFGIARGADLSADLTGPDQVVGTIGYLAPECLDTAARGRVGPAADVWAWGVLVGYAATGRTPFHAESPLATVGRILTQPPDLDGLTGPLRHLVESALAKDPERRPAAPQLLDALLTAGRPGPDMTPELRKVALAAQAAGRPARRWIAWSVAAGLAAVLVAGSGVALARSHDRAQRQDRALAQRDLLNRSAEVLDTDPGLAVRLAVSAEAISPSPRGRAAVTAALATGYDGELGAGPAVHTVEYRPDGAMVATGGADRVDLWTVADHRFTRAASLPVEDAETTDLSFSPDGGLLATAGARLRIWDVAGGRELSEIPGRAWDSVQFSGDGGRLLTASDQIELWDVREPARPRAVWRMDAGAVTRGGARLSPDGTVLAAVASGESLTVWSTPPDRPARQVAVLEDANAVLHLAFSPDGRTLAAATVSDGIRFYDVSDPARPRYRGALGAEQEPPTAVAFDRTGTVLAVGGGERAIALWSVAVPDQAVPIRNLRRDGGWASSIDFAPDGSRVLTAGWEGARTSAALWRLDPLTPPRLAALPGEVDRFRQVTVSAGGVVAVSTAARTAFLDVRDPARPVQARPPLAVRGASRLRLGRAETLVLTGGAVIDLSGAEPRVLLDGVRPVLDLDPERGLAAVLDPGSRVLIYRVTPAPEILGAVPASRNAVAAFDTRTGALVVADDNGGTESALTTWDLTDPTSPRAMTSLAGQGGFLQVTSRDGLVVGVHRDVLTWSSRNGVPVMRSAPRERTPGTMVTTLSLSVDRTLLALTSGSGTELWALSGDADPLPVAVLPGMHTGSALSPSQPLLVTADLNGIQIFDLTALRAVLADPLAAACARATGLGAGEWPAHVPSLPYEPACR